MTIRKDKRKTPKAPGKSHRTGISFKGLMRLFPDNATAEKWFQKQMWEGVPRCPSYGSTTVNLKAKHPSMPHRCKETGCYKFFSVKTGTVMDSSKISCQDCAIATYL